MRDVKKYWQDVREVERTLPEFVWLAPADSRDSSNVVQAPSTQAARLMLAKSHRIATDDEVQAFHTRGEDWQRQTREDALRKKGIAVVPVRGNF